MVVAILFYFLSFAKFIRYSLFNILGSSLGKRKTKISIVEIMFSTNQVDPAVVLSF